MLKAYVDAISDNRLQDAKQRLLEAIVEATHVGAAPVLAGLAQRLGSVLLRQGDKIDALCLYELSECLDSNSLLPMLDYAKFLLHEIKDKSSAAIKCNAIIARAESHPFPESDDDFSSAEYATAARRLLKEAISN